MNRLIAGPCRGRDAAVGATRRKPRHQARPPKKRARTAEARFTRSRIEGVPITSEHLVPPSSPPPTFTNALVNHGQRRVPNANGGGRRVRRDHHRRARRRGRASRVRARLARAVGVGRAARRRPDAPRAARAGRQQRRQRWRCRGERAAADHRAAQGGRLEARRDHRPHARLGGAGRAGRQM